MHFNEIDLTGLTFDKLTIIKRTEKRGKNNEIYWLCKCECGEEKLVTGEMLRSKKAKSCGHLRENPPNKIGDRKLAIKNNLYYHLVIKRSKEKSFDYNLTFNDFVSLIDAKCFYCGSEGINIAVDRLKNGNLTILKYNGIDRINNNIGYLKENCVTCCKYCNSAKSDRTFEEFIGWLKNLSRQFIGIEKEENYYKICLTRLDLNLAEPLLLDQLQLL